MHKLRSAALILVGLQAASTSIPASPALRSPGGVVRGGNVDGLRVSIRGDVSGRASPNGPSGWHGAVGELLSDATPQLRLRGGGESEGKSGEGRRRRRPGKGEGGMQDDDYGSDSEQEVPEWLDAAADAQQKAREGPRTKEQQYLDAMERATRS
ncbi:hypothetical protein T484DRAFT_2955214 [Baffinella frigidus]|nr:hypothetical protein T484DRAFT_2955214 [Cryptophyta sp. CCMP2293]